LISVNVFDVSMKNVRNLVPLPSLRRIFQTDIGNARQTFSTIDIQLVEPQAFGRGLPLSDIPINVILDDWKKSVSKYSLEDPKTWLHQHITELERKRDLLVNKGDWRDHIFDESLSYLLRQVRKHSLQWTSMMVNYFMDMYGKRNSHERTPSSIEIFFEICAQTNQVEPIREGKPFYP
jgi:hypothetical protein